MTAPAVCVLPTICIERRQPVPFSNTEQRRLQQQFLLYQNRQRKCLTSTHHIEALFHFPCRRNGIGNRKDTSRRKLLYKNTISQLCQQYRCFAASWNSKKQCRLQRSLHCLPLLLTKTNHILVFKDIFIH